MTNKGLNTLVLTYDSNIFLSLIGSYGIIWAWFMFLIARFLSKIEFKLDRIPNYLINKTVLAGDECSVLSSLFISYKKSPCNIEFRAHLYHAFNVILFILLIPVFLILSWGFSCTALLQPPALGFGVAFIGSATIFLWYGFRFWETDNYRMNPTILISISISTVLFFCFAIAAVYLNIDMFLLIYEVNFPALSLVFGAMNTIPLLLLTLQKDKNYQDNLQLVVQKLQESVILLNDSTIAVDSIASKKDDINKSFKNTESIQESVSKTSFNTSSNKVLFSLLQYSYTINPNIGHFRFGTVLPEVSVNTADDSNDHENINNNSIKDTSNKQIKNINKNNYGFESLYFLSIMILALYMIIAAVSSDQDILALMNILTLLLLDFINTSFAGVNNTWSPGSKIILLSLGRLVIMSSSGSFWTINYSVTYIIYSLPMVYQAINQVLPLLSMRQAGQYYIYVHTRICLTNINLSIIIHVFIHM